MDNRWTDRTALLLGEDKMERLARSHVLVVGVGGVGAYAADMICRAGVGEMTIVDADIINVTNINRQLPAMHSTLGQSKVEVMAQRLRDVNPDIKLHVLETYLTEEGVFPLLAAQKFDFVVDAIDTIAPKCALIMETLRRGIPIVSSMGAGAKSDITKIRFADLWETYHCGLAKAVRTRLKKAGVRQSLPVVFSTEQADRNAVVIVEGEQNKKSTAGTISYMPAVFGCYLAEYVIRKI
jgi:tRNA A37 threonylcarbamoyladenosine dehydratase